MGYNSSVAKAQRTMLDAIKLHNGCEVCKISNATVLDFDHINPAMKLHNVSRMVGRYTFATILREVAKCRVLCANCHRLHTAEQRK
jgi:hypothetical protein